MERIIKLSKGFAVPFGNVNYISDYKNRAIIEKTKLLKQEDKCFSVAGRKKVETVVFLKDGSAICTDISFDTILNRMEGE